MNGSISQQRSHEIDNADLLDIQQAAGLLNLSRSTVYALTSRRQVPHYKKGGKLYFLRSELLAWLMDGKREVIDSRAADKHLRSKGSAQ